MSKTKITYICIFAVLTVLAFVACSNSDPSEAIPAIEQTQFQRPPEDMRNFRYCEILPIFQSGTDLYIEVYGTIGLSECPDEQWRALSADDIAEEYGAVQVTMNGPRFLLMNETVASGASADGKIADFGGIQMRSIAVLERKLSQGTVGESSYVENEVQRTTTFTYLAGNMVYELISPNGDVYRMQSYTHQVDPTLTIDDLETLGDRLDLPDGWRYQAQVLSEDSQLIADGLAFVISDNLLNAYQKIIAPAE